MQLFVSNGEQCKMAHILLILTGVNIMDEKYILNGGHIRIKMTIYQNDNILMETKCMD